MEKALNIMCYARMFNAFLCSFTMHQGRHLETNY